MERPSAVTVTEPIALAVVGVGKIARDQHLPSIAANPAFRLGATVSRSGGVDGVENFETIEQLLNERPDIAAVSLCQPPQVRFDAAAAAIAARRHVLLEKPPGATVSEVRTLRRLAEANGVTLFATWHSRFAAAVERARDWLASRTVHAVKITWKEDVRRWHPGQDWIWQPGGLGVFDPGINALSIVTRLLPALRVTGAVLEFPSNRDAPIAAGIEMAGEGFDASAEFDWRQTGPQTWDIEVATNHGTLVLTNGGARMLVDGEASLVAEDREYPGIYAHFAGLVRTGRSDVDLVPLMLVADAFMVGRRVETEAFEIG